MAYLDNLLASGEQPIRREHQHWFVLLADARYSILAWVVAVLLLIVNNAIFAGNSSLAGVGSALGWVVFVLVIGGLLYLGWQILRWQNELFIVTSRRVLQAEGVINKRVVDSSLEKINDAILSESIVGRMFGFGDLEILTASESGISLLRMLPHPDAFKRAMMDAKHDLEMELSGARPLPSPAMRAAGPTMNPVPAPSAAPPASPAPPPNAMSSDDVTRTLASLADLRDRGAISPDEYEAKKAELLRRL
jgi:PH (Pleckstrin Homology) domain-containing protein/putative oligomerization/nucleic acid binding protein